MSKRKSKSNSSSGFDIKKVLADPVRTVPGGKSKKMTPYEATMRQHLRKALVEKSVLSMKYIFGQASKHDIIKQHEASRSSGVLTIPKWVPQEGQKEIFDFQPEDGKRDLWERMARIIARYIHDRPKQKAE